MPENTIIALFGLIASAVICYGIPQNYYSSNAKAESVSFACDPENLSENSSPWHAMPGDQTSLTKRDYRDLQSHEWSNSQNQEYESGIQEFDATQSSDFYPYPPDTCRAIRESIGNSPYIVQAPISDLGEAEKSGSTSSQTPVTNTQSSQSSSSSQNPSSSPSYQSPPSSPSSLSYQNPPRSSSSPNSLNPPSSPSSLSSPSYENPPRSSSSPMIYENYQPKNLPTPDTSFQTSPYVSYPGPYYCPTGMIGNYNPYQTMATEQPFAIDDEDDYTDQLEYPPQRFYVLYRADMTNSGINNAKLYPISNEKMEKPITDIELEDVIKKAVKVAKQQSKQQNTLHQQRDSEEEIQKNSRKVYEKREHLNSGIILAPEIKRNPFNLPPEMNLKEKLEETLKVVKELSKPMITEKDNENDKTEYDDAREDEDDLWGINRWEATKQMEEKKDTTFNGDFRKEDEDKLADQKFSEDLLKQEKLKEEKTAMIVDKKDEMVRFKKEASKHLEAEEMKKETSEKMEEDSEEDKGQIMRIEKIKTQVEKYDTIKPVIS